MKLGFCKLVILESNFGGEVGGGRREKASTDEGGADRFGLEAGY